MKPLVALLLALCSLSAAAEIRISGGRINQLPDGSQVVFDLSAPVAHRSFLLPDPPRFVVDLKDTDVLGLRYDLNSPDIRGVRTGTRNGRDLRIVVDLNRAMLAKVTLIQQGGHHLVLDFFRNRKPVFQHPATVAYVTPSSVTQPVPPPQIALAGTNLPSLELISRSLEPVQRPLLAAPVSKPQPALAEPLPKPATMQDEQRSEPQPARSRPTAIKLKRREVLIAIDPGHGGKDTGAVGPRGTREKHVVLQIAHRLKKLIDAREGMHAFLTRNDDRYLRLYQRIAITRQRKADLFISIHADAYYNPDPRGASVYMLSTRGATSTMARWLAESENKSGLVDDDLDIEDEQLRKVVFDMVHDAVLADSSDIAGNVLDELDKVGELHSRKVERANFAVLKSPDIPSILVETAFISNPNEERRLATSDYQTKLARAILRGIEGYLEARPGLGMEIVDADDTPANSQPYTIRRGDTLSDIAQRYEVSVASLLDVNGLSSADNIPAGITIQIPGG